MDELKACPVCTGVIFKPFLQTRDYFLSQEKFSIIQCNECGFKFTNPRPSETSLPLYYQSDAYISHTNSGKGLIPRIYKIVRNRSLSKKVKLVKRFIKKGSVLDIGCGTGHFLNRLSNHGFSVTGVEPESSAREFAVAKFNLHIENSLSDINPDKTRFQVITLWHALEHVFNLNVTLGYIKRLLSAGGFVIAAVPNPDSYDALHYRKFWAAYDLPRHLYHFSPATIQQLFFNHQFELVTTAPMKFDAFYVSLLSEKYKRGKTSYLRAFSVGMKSNIRAALSQNNYSSIIYIFRLKK